MERVTVISSADGSPQPALFYAPDDAQGLVPLLVVLHSWSADYRQAEPRRAMLDEARARGWAMIHPHFRGPNVRPEACGSPLAIADVLDAVVYAAGRVPIDPSRVYLFGSSGGGHMALVMAHAAPKRWAGVSAWVPVTDLAAWHAFHSRGGEPGRYARHLEAVCGGPPGEPAADAQYTARSPLFHLAGAAGLPIDLNAGLHDGHTGSVPIDHTLRAFNVLARANGHDGAAIGPGVIEAMTARRQLPADPGPVERANARPRRYPAVFRREAGPVRVTIFDGGHTHDAVAAARWLARQRRPGAAELPTRAVETPAPSGTITPAASGSP